MEHLHYWATGFRMFSCEEIPEFKGGQRAEKEEESTTYKTTGLILIHLPCSREKTDDIDTRYHTSAEEPKHVNNRKGLWVMEDRKRKGPTVSTMPRQNVFMPEGVRTQWADRSLYRQKPACTLGTAAPASPKEATWTMECSTKAKKRAREKVQRLKHLSCKTLTLLRSTCHYRAWLPNTHLLKKFLFINK